MAARCDALSLAPIRVLTDDPNNPVNYKYLSAKNGY